MENLPVENIKNCLKSKSIDSNFYHSLLSVLNNIKLDDNFSATWHPLGFIIITIQDWHLGERLRIHIWPKSIRKYNQGRNWIHNHEYNINSLVLVGKVINKRYILHRKSKGLPTYNVVHQGNNSDLIITGKFCEVKYLCSEEIKKGKVYTIKKSEYHLSETKTEIITATIVLNSEKSEESPTIIGIAEEKNSFFHYERKSCNKLFLNDLISELIKEVNKYITSVC